MPAARRRATQPALGMAITLSAPPGLSRLAPALRSLVRSTLTREGRRVGEIGIVLGDDAGLRDLNLRWRGIDRATDVLSFAYDELGLPNERGLADERGGAARGGSLARPFGRASCAPSLSEAVAPAIHGSARLRLPRKRSPALRSPVAGAGSGASVVSGDLVISLDRVAAQARRFRVSRGRELARLAVHGTLHLAGLDHQRAAERKLMRRREDRALVAATAAVKTLDRLLASGARR